MHVIGSREAGGAERFFVRLTRALDQRGESLLCVLRPGSVLARHLPAGVRKEAVRMRSIIDPFAKARIGALARAFEAHVVQTYMGRATRLARFNGRRPGPIHVARVGGYYDVKGYQHAHAWVATTAGIRRYLVDSGLPPERVFHIGHLVETPPAPDAGEIQALREQLHLGPGDCVLMCAGRLHRDRGVDVLLEALARLPEATARGPLRLLVVGDGPERDALAEQAATLGVAPRVRWVHEAVAPEPYLSLASLFVYPSRESPVGTAILEAWNHELPVIASTAAGPAERIEDRRTGVLVPVEDPDALAGAIQDYLEDRLAVKAMVHAASERVDTEFRSDRVASAYRDVYAQLLDDVS